MEKTEIILKHYLSLSINAYGIIGQTRELVAHNTFDYYKNESIKFSDPSGFRKVSASEILARLCSE